MADDLIDAGAEQPERELRFTPDAPIGAANVVALVDRQGTARFTCIGCGEEVISLCHHGAPVCAMCRGMPGWHRNPELARIFRHQPAPLGPDLPAIDQPSEPAP